MTESKFRCHFNEVCLCDLFSDGAAASAGLESLVSLLDLLKRRVPTFDLLGLERCRGKPLASDGWMMDQWMKTLERERCRKIKSLLINRPSYPTSPSAQPLTFLGEEALGITYAHSEGTLAISLLTSDLWNRPFLIADTAASPAGWGESPEPPLRVRHVAQEEHLEAHSDWLSLRFELFADFCRQVNPSSARYKLASEYRKHVCGGTNEERQRAAVGSSADGQYLSRKEGRAIGDSQITAWERTALETALGGGAEARIERHSPSTFYVFFRQNEVVGYQGGSGEETHVMRVEWSSGDVHSHPC